MPQCHVHKTRQYTGPDGSKRETVTYRLKTSVRVLKVQDRVDAGVRAPGSMKRQASRGQVYGWADKDEECGCVRRCHEEFTIDRVNDADVVTARLPLYDTTMTKSELCSKLHSNWQELLVMPNGQPVCVTMACRIFACSRSKLYPSTKRRRRSRAEANANRSTKSVSIASWFYALGKVVDIMPDHGWYQLPHARKKHVWAQYQEECANNSLYTKCRPALFYRVWREQFSQFRLRKHCRFTSAWNIEIRATTPRQAGKGS